MTTYTGKQGTILIIDDPYEPLLATEIKEKLDKASFGISGSFEMTLQDSKKIKAFFDNLTKEKENPRKSYLKFCEEPWRKKRGRK